MPCSNSNKVIPLSSLIICCYCNFVLTSPTLLHMFIRYILDYTILEFTPKHPSGLGEQRSNDQLIQNQNEHWDATTNLKAWQ